MTTINSNDTQIKSDINYLATVLNLDTDDIEVIRPNWLALMRRGVLVSLHLRRWRAMATLTPGHLGINFETEQEQKDFEKSMSLGHLFLLPAKFLTRLSTIDSASRKVSKKHCFETYWGDFLTPEAHENWVTEIEAYKAKYFEVRDDIDQNWADITFEVIDMHTANAKAAYRRESDVLARGGKSTVASQMTESTFVARYIDLILESIPSRQEVYDSFAFEVDYTYIPLPSLMAEDEAKAQVAQEWAQAERAKIKAEQTMRAKIADQYRARYDELIVDNMSRMVAQVNETLYTMAQDVLATAQANETLHPRSVVQIGKAIERIKALNVFDYDDIERMTTQAESIINTPASDRALKSIEGTMRDIATVTRATLVSLDSLPSRQNRKDGITVQVPTNDENIRQARGRLGLAQPAQEPTKRQARKI